MTDSYPVPVRWRDLDHLGHVYHGTILTMLDEARTMWLAAEAQVDEPDSYVVARIELDYRRPLLKTEEALHVHFAVRRVGTRSITLAETATAATSRAVIAESLTTIVFWDKATTSSRPITTSERQRLTAAEERAT